MSDLQALEKCTLEYRTLLAEAEQAKAEFDRKYDLAIEKLKTVGGAFVKCYEQELVQEVYLVQVSEDSVLVVEMDVEEGTLRSFREVPYRPF